MGGGHPDPAGGGGGLLVSKKIFRPFGPQFGLKIKVGGLGDPRASPLDPPLQLCYFGKPPF